MVMKAVTDSYPRSAETCCTLAPAANSRMATIRCICWRQRPKVKLGLIAAVVVILIAAGITAYLLRPNASRQTVLPFTGLNQPYAVAVDAAGNVYVTDWGNNRLLKLPAG